MDALDNVLGAAQVAGAFLFSPLLRGWYNRWGTTQEEADRPLPGDELVPEPRLGYTRAITIQAPVERVWSWLVQIGQGRGGLYSYDGLENLAGCKIHSADRILPEHQDLKSGDLIRLGPKGYPCFAAISIEPYRALVLVSAGPKTEQPVIYTQDQSRGFSIATWQFVLEPLDGSACRLIVRQRLAYSPDIAWVWRLTEPIAFVMERKMLLGIRTRAENYMTRSSKGEMSS